MSWYVNLRKIRGLSRFSRNKNGTGPFPKRGRVLGLAAGMLTVWLVFGGIISPLGPLPPLLAQEEVASEVDQPAEPSEERAEASDEAAKAPDEVGESSDEAAEESGEATEGPGEPAEESEEGAEGEAVVEEADQAEVDWYRQTWFKLVVALLVVILPFVLGSALAKRFRMPDYSGKITLVLLCLFAGVAVTVMGFPPKLGIDLRGGVILVYEIGEVVDVPTTDGPDEEDQDDEGDAAAGPSARVDMDKLVTAVGRRVNPGGVKEVTIRERGAGEIEIIIPEVDEAEVRRLKGIISSVGTLEFRILANNRDHKSLIAEARVSDANVSYVLDENGRIELDQFDNPRLRWKWVPVTRGQEDSFPYSEIERRKRSRRGGEEVEEILVVGDPFNVNGGYLSKARTSIDQSARPCVLFTFNSRGGQLFGGLTSNNLPTTEGTEFSRKLGIILDDYLYSAPRIRSTIREQGEIIGDFSPQEVQDLVDVLNAGSLPAKLSENPISELVTGPTLGIDTIRKGSVAIALSLVLVLAFMLVYYRFSGVVACMALLMTLVMLLAIMITVKAAFTLPGIAALVLTVGIAVDANVLIFERIREELSRKATLRMAIRNGFGRATSAIVDANLTTLIIATVLYIIGTDQIRGFAVTLWLGVVLSMFTAVYCSRVVFDIAEKQKWITKLSMMRIIGGTNINFLGKRQLAAVLSIAMICLGLVGVFQRGKGILDIDFTGGVSIQVLFSEEQDIARIRGELSDLDDLAVSAVTVQGEVPNRRFIVNTSITAGTDAEQYSREVRKRITDAFGEKLVHYSMTIKTMPIGGVLPEADEDRAEPMVEKQGRSDLPADTLLVSADPTAVLLAQAEEPGEPLQQPAEMPADEAAPAGSSRFVGGTWAKLEFEHAVSYETLQGMFREEFESDRFKAVDFELSNQDYLPGDDTAYDTWDVQIKLPPQEAEVFFSAIKDRLEGTPVFPSSSSIGGKVARSLQVKGMAALLASLVFIVGYIWIRFQRVMFGLAAVVALVHDVLITLGVIALSYYVADFLGFLLIDEFKISLSVLAAFLTIIGYSLNDTIVVFDRIREVRGKAPRLTEQMINTSINQTLSRTLLTSLTTLLVVVILYIGGGQGIHAFAFSLVVGVLVGTYSSIFVASPVLLWMSRPAHPGHSDGN